MVGGVLDGIVSAELECFRCLLGVIELMYREGVLELSDLSDEEVEIYELEVEGDNFTVYFSYEGSDGPRLSLRWFAPFHYEDYIIVDEYLIRRRVLSVDVLFEVFELLEEYLEERMRVSGEVGDVVFREKLGVVLGKLRSCRREFVGGVMRSLERCLG